MAERKMHLTQAVPTTYALQDTDDRYYYCQAHILTIAPRSQLELNSIAIYFI